MNPGRGVIMCSTSLDHRRKEDLRNDGTEFSEAGADAVAGGPDARGENLGRGDESRCVRAYR